MSVLTPFLCLVVHFVRYGCKWVCWALRQLHTAGRAGGRQGEKCLWSSAGVWKGKGGLFYPEQPVCIFCAQFSVPPIARDQGLCVDLGRSGPYTFPFLAHCKCSTQLIVLAIIFSLSVLKVKWWRKQLLVKIWEVPGPGLGEKISLLSLQSLDCSFYPPMELVSLNLLRVSRFCFFIYIWFQLVWDYTFCYYAHLFVKETCKCCFRKSSFLLSHSTCEVMTPHAFK